jgi:hypothetical protein
MCANGGESNKETRAFVANFGLYTIYIYPNQNVIRSASYIKCFFFCFEKEANMWISGFCLCGESKKKNARVLKDVTSFLSNSIGPSSSTQQWGLKSLEERLVKDEIIGFNEG